MQKVVTINLNGNAYQLDEDGYELLHSYLASARSRLGDNPDLEEIMSDLEQAVADKCNRFLNATKNVVTRSEIAQVVEEMGPVDSEIGNAGDEAADGESDPGAGRQARRQGSVGWEPRRLYRLTEDKMVAGVCAGLAAYFGVDVSLVRIIFAAAAFATGGLAGAAYIVMVAVIPEATTPEEHAAAYGAPFNAQDVVDHARTKFDDFTNGKEWKRRWRAQKRYWRRHGDSDGIPPPLRVLLMFFAIAVGISFLSGMLRMFGNIGRFGPVFGPWTPLFTLMLFVVGLNVIFWVLRGGRRTYPSPIHGFLVGFTQLFLILLVLWFAYNAFPPVREFVDRVLIVFYRAFM